MRYILRRYEGCTEFTYRTEYVCGESDHFWKCAGVSNFRMKFQEHNFFYFNFTHRGPENHVKHIILKMKIAIWDNIYMLIHLTTNRLMYTWKCQNTVVWNIDYRTKMRVWLPIPNTFTSVRIPNPCHSHTCAPALQRRIHCLASAQNQAYQPVIFYCTPQMYFIRMTSNLSRWELLSSSTLVCDSYYIM